MTPQPSAPCTDDAQPTDYIMPPVAQDMVMPDEGNSEPVREAASAATRC